MSDWDFLNKCRVRQGPLRSDESFGWNGAFSFALPSEPRLIHCICSDSSDMPGAPLWQHVSVSFGRSNHKTPSWELMCRIKDLFWDPEDVVIQIHASRSQWINNHPGCLHLWRCMEPTTPQPLPPAIFVGVPGVTFTKP